MRSSHFLTDKFVLFCPFKIHVSFFQFLEYIDLTNEAARLNVFRDGTEMKIEPYESDTFVEEMDETWRGLKPLYEQLHAYVRHKLAKK